MGQENKMDMKEACCPPYGGRHKRKLIIVIVAVLLGLVVLALAAGVKKFHAGRNFGNYGCGDGPYAVGDYGMMERCGFLPGDLDPFYPPQDAAKKGELTVVAADAEHVKQAVAEIAAKNDGKISSSKTSYAKDGKKRGSMVIQVPADKFEAVFNAIKTMGARVASESTETLPQNNFIYPLAADAQAVEPEISQPIETQPDQGASNRASDSASTGVAMPSIYPMPAPLTQDKGYIRIRFSDNGKSWGGNWAGGRSNTQTIAVSGNDFVVIFGHNLLKGSLLILLIAILLWFVKKLKEIKIKTPARKTTIPAVKKVVVKKAAIKRSRVIRKK